LSGSWATIEGAKMACPGHGPPSRGPRWLVRVKGHHRGGQDGLSGSRATIEGAKMACPGHGPPSRGPRWLVEAQKKRCQDTFARRGADFPGEWITCSRDRIVSAFIEISVGEGWTPNEPQPLVSSLKKFNCFSRYVKSKKYYIIGCFTMRNYFRLSTEFVCRLKNTAAGRVVPDRPPVNAPAPEPLREPLLRGGVLGHEGPVQGGIPTESAQIAHSETNVVDVSHLQLNLKNWVWTANNILFGQNPLYTPLRKHPFCDM